MTLPLGSYITEQNLLWKVSPESTYEVEQFGGQVKLLSLE
jgi:hypothetical protein